MRKILAQDSVPPEQAVTALEALYKEWDRGFVKDSMPAEPVQELGGKLNEVGGFQLMLDVHQLFAQKRPDYARNLEMVWAGIGDWRG